VWCRARAAECVHVAATRHCILDAFTVACRRQVLASLCWRRWLEVRAISNRDAAAVAHTDRAAGAHAAKEHTKYVALGLSRCCVDIRITLCTRCCSPSSAPAATTASTPAWCILTLEMHSGAFKLSCSVMKQIAQFGPAHPVSDLSAWIDLNEQQALSLGRKRPRTTG
jgi:hypothetical protein